MTTCDRWQHLCEPAKGPPDPDLLVHLESCPECRAAWAKWRALEPEIAKSVALNVDDLPVRDRIVLDRVHARLGKNRRPSVPRLVWVGAAAGVAAVVAILILNFGLAEDGSTPRADSHELKASATVFAADGTAERKLELEPGASFEVAPGERASLRIDRHRIDLRGSSALRLAELSRSVVVIDLARGEASFDVDFGTERGTFSVTAGDVVVSVKGTRFTVMRNAELVTVAVEEGRVAVARKGREIAILAAKERLEIDTAKPASAAATEPVDANGAAKSTPALPSEAQPKTARVGEPNLAALRELVISGRLDQAEAGLAAFVARHPGDAEAWWILGDCRRKEGKHAAAVEAYRQVIAVGPPDQVDLARLKAGTILQEKLGRHADAVALFREYLKSGGSKASLRAEVLVRCGRSLIALGRDADAEPLLREVVEEFAANPVAAEARALLAKTE